MNEYTSEIIVAIVSVVGTALVALITNWEKFFPPKEAAIIIAQDYSESADYETELRKMLSLTRARDTMAVIVRQMLEQILAPTLNAAGIVDEKVRIDTIEKISSDFNILDATIPDLVSIYKKYLDLEDIIEINKMYSTKSMKKMIEKNALIMQETSILGARVFEDHVEKMSPVFEKYIEDAIEGR